MFAGRGSNAQAAASHRTQEREYNPTSHSGIVQEGLPTPASLAEVMLSTRQMLIEQAGEHLFVCAKPLYFLHIMHIVGTFYFGDP